MTPILTVLEKCYGPRWSSYLRLFEEQLKSSIEGLEAVVDVLGRTSENWIQVGVSGADAAVVRQYLKKRFGLSPTSIKNIKLFSKFRGRIIDAGKVGFGLYVDIGVYDPRHIDVLIPLYLLRSQLTDGRKLPVTRIVEAFSLYDFIPLEIQVTKINLDAEVVEGRLSTSQISILKEWFSMGLDRIIVVGASRREVNRAVKKSSVGRYVVKVIQLGFLEQLLLCKLGTEGPGIIKKIGSALPNKLIHLFSPKRVKKLLESDELSLEAYDCSGWKRPLRNFYSKIIYIILKSLKLFVNFSHLTSISVT